MSGGEEKVPPPVTDSRVPGETPSLHVFLQVWSLGGTTDAKACLQASSCVQETSHKDYASRDVQKELFGPDGQRISVIDKGLDLLASLAEVYLLNRFSEQAE